MKKTKIYSLMLMLILLLSFPMSADAAKVKLNKKSITLPVAKTYKLKVKGTKKKVKWKSSNKKVAYVNKHGKVVAKKRGKATITAKVGKKKYKCKVTVYYSAKQAVSILEKKLKSRNAYKCAYCDCYSVKYRLYDKDGFIDELDDYYEGGNEIDSARFSGYTPKRLGSYRVSCIFEYLVGEGVTYVFAEINLVTGKASIYLTDEWRDWVNLPSTIQL